MLTRERHLRLLIQAIEESPVTSILGARQVGKTTLARQVQAWALEQGLAVHYFDLEIPSDAEALSNPYTMLASLHGLVVIDEIQRQPELFSVLRPLADRPDAQTKFLILGSASPQILDGVSESLAGRNRTIDLSGLRIDEIEEHDLKQLWLRGGFPRSFLAKTDAASVRWRNDFIRSFLERDIPQLGYRIPAQTLRRFWMMLAHQQGGLFNASQLARAMGMSVPTIKHYLDIFAGTYMLRILEPWHEHVGKRLVKQPKVYIRDSGFVHALIDIPNERALRSHTIAGDSWEGFVIEQILAVCGEGNAYFYRTHGGAELDLLLLRQEQRYGFEIKLNEKPTISKSMRIAIDDLQLKHLYLIYGGNQRYQLDEQITAIPVRALEELATAL